MSEANRPADDRRIPTPRGGEDGAADLWPSVAVVVPTTLRRASLPQALRSAKDQDYAGRVVLVVVVDRDESGCETYEKAWLSEADVVVWTGGGALGGRARNLGVEASRTDLVAFLDDDDLWRPTKLTLQVRRLLQVEQGRPVVVGSRVVEVRCDTDERSRPVPETLIADGQAVGDYLFRDRRPTLDRASLHTSTLLMRRTTAVAVPWSEGLTRHQDWDWVLRAEADAGAVVVQVPEVAVEHYLGSVASVSASPDWRSSLAWASAWRHRWSARTYSDFVCGQPLRYAVQARSREGVRRCLDEVRRSGRLPATGPAVLAAGSLLPRPLLERISHRAHRGDGREVPVPGAAGAGVADAGPRAVAEVPAPRRPTVEESASSAPTPVAARSGRGTSVV